MQSEMRAHTPLFEDGKGAASEEGKSAGGRAGRRSQHHKRLGCDEGGGDLNLGKSWRVDWWCLDVAS